MGTLPPRDLSQEVSKHLTGAPEERLLMALRLGHQVLDYFLASLPPGTTTEEARALFRKNKHAGRVGARPKMESGV